MDYNSHQPWPLAMLVMRNVVQDHLEGPRLVITPSSRFLSDYVKALYRLNYILSIFSPFKPCFYEHACQQLGFWKLHALSPYLQCLPLFCSTITHFQSSTQNSGHWENVTESWNLGVGQGRTCSGSRKMVPKPAAFALRKTQNAVSLLFFQETTEKHWL